MRFTPRCTATSSSGASRAPVRLCEGGGDVKNGPTDARTHTRTHTLREPNRLTPSCDAGYAASTTLALQAMAQRHGRSLPLEITTKDAALGFLWDVANERRHKAWTALLGIRLALEHFEYVFFLSRASYVAQLASPIEPLFKHLGVGKLVLVPESVLRFDPRAHISTDKQFVMQKLRWSKKHNRGLLGIRAAGSSSFRRNSVAFAMQ